MTEFGLEQSVMIRWNVEQRHDHGGELGNHGEADDDEPRPGAHPVRAIRVMTVSCGGSAPGDRR